MSNLEIQIGSMKWKNPVTVASGTFGYEYDELFDLSQLGALVTKTITLNPKKGNEPCRLAETRAGLLNSIGLQNPGVEEFITEKLIKYDKYKTNLVVSISGSTIDEFCQIADKLNPYDNIDAYEINISCPNVEKEGLAFGVEAEVVRELIAKLRATTDKDIIVKLTPNVTKIEEIARAAAESGADIISLINTVLGLAVDIETKASRIKNGIAGYSGPAIKPIALQNVFRVAQAVDIPIIGMGGICNTEDALEFLMVGASAVAMGTANFSNPLITLDIIKGLEMYLGKNNTNLREIIGSFKLQ
ncbi:MAG: dihydroorotate dehydrogenase [Candidatus Cloacimonetes bacterium]|nr:dihydroorotate dehydrogenase [Candidatus Cloacimonadota bacterium]